MIDIGRQLALKRFAEFEQASGNQEVGEDTVVGGVLEGCICGRARREEGCDVGYEAWVGVAGGDEDFLGGRARVEDGGCGFGGGC